MKRLIGIMLILALALCLCACTEEKPELTDNEFILQVRNDCDEKIKGFHIEYGLGESSLGEGGCVNADGSDAKKGEVFSFNYLRKDFPQNGEDISDFYVRIYVMTDTDETKEYASELRSIDAKFGEITTVSVSGNKMDGFIAQIEK